MAKNLRTKIPSSDSMIIHDVNPAVTEQFAKEVGNVSIANNVRELAEQSVCLLPFTQHISYTRNDDRYCSIHDLSWQP